MFCPGITALIQGRDIDRPRNALILNESAHTSFDKFSIYFEATETPHTYVVKSFYRRLTGYPRICKLRLTPDRTIDPPSPQLLAVHAAIGHILHMSGAGEYVDNVFHDLDECAVQADGSTPLGPLVSLAMNGPRPFVCA